MNMNYTYHQGNTISINFLDLKWNKNNSNCLLNSQLEVHKLLIILSFSFFSYI